MGCCRWGGADLILDCHPQPKASRDEFAGRHAERVKIRLNAPPVDGKANAQPLAFLATAFGVGKSQVSLESGRQSRQKRVRIKTAQRPRPDRSTLLSDHKTGRRCWPIDTDAAARIIPRKPILAVPGLLSQCAGVLPRSRHDWSRGPRRSATLHPKTPNVINARVPQVVLTRGLAE